MSDTKPEDGGCQEEYKRRLQQLQNEGGRVQTQHAAAAVILAVALALVVILGVYASRRRIPRWWPALPIPIAAAAVQHYRRSRDLQTRTWRLLRYYRRGMDRLQGAWPGQGFTGDQFAEPDHLYARDLGVIGEGSLFELLCIARTGIGRRSLANHLLHAPPTAETTARQEAVRELAPMTELREQVAALGEFESAESTWETFAGWLDSPAVSFPKYLGAIALVSSALLACIVIAGLLTAGPNLPHWIALAMWMSPFLLLHSIVGLVFRTRVNRALESLHSLSVEAGVLREGLELLEKQRFQSAKLAQLTEDVRDSSHAVRKLERLLAVLAHRDKEAFYLASRALLAGTQVCIAVQQWRDQYGASLRRWIDAWGEFEALNALANYAHENADAPFPAFHEGPAQFEASGLGHPLLRNDVCIRNDVRLDSRTRFYVVSGSNMAGKSTLLRSIGLNAVLAFAGAPVRARALSLSPLTVGASLSVTDSLLNGKSKFLAEVDQLRRILQAADGGRPALFLIDEIFSGTNSRDRRAAGEAVVRELMNRGAIGVLSTHDMSLTEIAGAEGLSGENVHMGSAGGSDPMDFDYRLKPGITTETNAIAIARMAGIPL